MEPLDPFDKLRVRVFDREQNQSIRATENRRQQNQHDKEKRVVTQGGSV
jgi:hypothetical protein